MNHNPAMPQMDRCPHLAWCLGDTFTCLFTSNECDIINKELLERYKSSVASCTEI